MAMKISAKPVRHNGEECFDELHNYKPGNLWYEFMLLLLLLLDKCQNNKNASKYVSILIYSR